MLVQKLKHLFFRHHATTHLRQSPALRFLAVPLVVAVVGGVTLALLYYRGSDAVRINLMGRQRMLTQKLSKQMLLYASGHVEPEQVSRTADLYERSLLALLHGGDVPVDLVQTTFRRLPPTRDRATRDKLKAAMADWKLHRRHLESFVASPDEERINDLVAEGNEVLSDADKIVRSMQAVAERNDALIGALLACMVLLVVALLIANSLQAVRSLKRVSEYADALEELIPVCSFCRRVRTEGRDPADPGSWTSMETYLRQRTSQQLSHGICPECLRRHYGDLADDVLP